MVTVSIVLNGIAMVLAFLAAWFWYQSASVKVPIEHGNKVGPEIHVDGYAFIATASKQALWSRRAAIAAAGAAFFQAVHLGLSQVAIY